VPFALNMVSGVEPRQADRTFKPPNAFRYARPKCRCPVFRYLIGITRCPQEKAAKGVDPAVRKKALRDGVTRR
jgi:hypothetical protein